MTTGEGWKGTSGPSMLPAFQPILYLVCVGVSVSACTRHVRCVCAHKFAYTRAQLCVRVHMQQEKRAYTRMHTRMHTRTRTNTTHKYTHKLPA